MLARVSMMLGQSSGPVPPPLPPKPWLDDTHRSIATHYFSEPGPLGLKVRVQVCHYMVAGSAFLHEKTKCFAQLDSCRCYRALRRVRRMEHCQAGQSRDGKYTLVLVILLRPSG